MPEAFIIYSHIRSIVLSFIYIGVTLCIDKLRVFLIRGSDPIYRIWSLTLIF